MSIQFNKGYSTGTFDMPHKRHFEVLKFIKLYCHIVIIGLTSDELAIKQKRKPIMNFEQRKSILESCKWVDMVIKHDGDTKDIAYTKIQFDCLFIGEEYFSKPEYNIFNKTPVIYIPQTTENIHTTFLIKDIEQRLINNLSVITTGISGQIMEFKTRDSHLIIKPIHIGYTESVNQKQIDITGKSMKTSNVYNMPFPDLPRNWKKKGLVVDKFPNIPGVNAFREIEFYNLFKRSWIPFLSINHVFLAQHVEQEQPEKPDKFDVDLIVSERKFPHEIIWMISHYSGITLFQWLQDNKNTHNFKQRLKNIITQVLEYIQDLRSHGVIHGDIHSKNVLVIQEVVDESTEKVYLIDFGWCYHPSFYLVCDELDYYKKLLADNFDLKHFYNSLIVDFEHLSIEFPLHFSRPF